VIEDGRIADVCRQRAASSRIARRSLGIHVAAWPDQLPRPFVSRRGSGSDTASQRGVVAVTAIKAAVRARQTLAAGVTTVRDLGGRDYCEIGLRRAIQDGLIQGPRILAAGRPVCMTGGHGHWLAREADGPDDVRKAVREQLKAGADVIKIIATGGVLTPGVEPGSPQLTLDEMRAAIEEARKAGRRTAAHAMGVDGIADAVKAGITSIEHGVYLSDEVVASMRSDGTYLVPTLIAPAAITAGGLSAGIPEFMVRKSERVMAAHVQSFQKALEAGVAIAAGSDAGTPLNPHGSLVPELVLMVKHGMTPLRALRSATAERGRPAGIGRDARTYRAGLRRGSDRRDRESGRADRGARRRAHRVRQRASNPTRRLIRRTRSAAAISFQREREFAPVDSPPAPGGLRRTNRRWPPRARARAPDGAHAARAVD
jgi:imidazolonepropionase-like amidohydrolase